MEDKSLAFIASLAQPTDSKILLLVVDGLGGLAHPDFNNKTELEHAKTPNLDGFVSLPTTAAGLVYPVARGITPGSGPGHLGLFGYDPLNQKYNIGRGALEASGLEFILKQNDLIFRMNFCQVDAEGKIIDRRAGRIASEESIKLCERLTQGISIPNAEVIVVPSREYRAVLVIRAQGELSDRVADTDPQREGLEPLPCIPFDPNDLLAKRTADIANNFVAQAALLLKGEPRANMVLLRGASRLPDIPKFGEVYQLRAAATANYPLYRGIARLIGMEIISGATDIVEQIDLVRKHSAEYTFFFMHYKNPDSAGEDGDFTRKVQAIEFLDQQIPAILDLGFDVIAITGDHSTPSYMHGHSWHSVPLVVSSRYMRRDDTNRLTEYECGKGSLGRLQARELMSILMAHAGKLRKFGA